MSEPSISHLSHKNLGNFVVKDGKKLKNDDTVFREKRGKSTDVFPRKCLMKLFLKSLKCFLVLSFRKDFLIMQTVSFCYCLFSFNWRPSETC